MVKKVVILQYRLLHYRVRLFSLLQEKLEEKGVALVLVHGQASDTEKQRKDEGQLSWATKVCNKFIRVAGVDILWQPYPKKAKNASLVIAMQENRIISNYKLQILYFLGFIRFAFWGHGRNYQATESHNLREMWKRFFVSKAAWWFGYTQGTANYLISQGFDSNKITNLNNAIDVSGFKQELMDVSEQKLTILKKSLNISNDAEIALFCGSIYAEKKIDFLLQAAVLIKKSIPNFYLLIIGDGPDSAIVKKYVEEYEWICWVGVKRGAEKAALFRLADIQLNPGLVGLHVLDAFASGLPMITTTKALHSPEIDYLVDGRNGFIVDSDDVGDYADVIINLLKNEEQLKQLKNQCLADSAEYTIENMATNFAEGIINCLKYYKEIP